MQSLEHATAPSFYLPSVPKSPIETAARKAANPLTLLYLQHPSVVIYFELNDCLGPFQLELIPHLTPHPIFFHFSSPLSHDRHQSLCGHNTPLHPAERILNNTPVFIPNKLSSLLFLSLLSFLLLFS